MNILTYFWIYSDINFIKFFKLTPLLIMSILGIIFYLYDIYTYHKVKKEYLIILLSISLSLIYFSSAVFNNVNDISNNPFIRYGLRQIKFFFAAFFMYQIYKQYKEKSFEIFCNHIINAVVFDNVIAVIRFFYSDLNLLLIKIQQSFGKDVIFENITLGKQRLVGVGAYFFGAGIINSLALILIAYLVLNRKKNNKNLILKYIIILIVGILSSRTTIIGGVLALILYLKDSKLQKFNLYEIGKKHILKIAMFIILVVVLILKNNAIKKLIINFLFVAGSQSLNALLQMWKLVPTEIKTWIIGDGKWNLYQFGQFKGYYQSTDVGYLRIIWCIGLLGLVLFLINSYLIARISFYKFYEDKNMKELIKYIFVLFLILNTKGYIDIFIIMYYVFISGVEKEYEGKQAGEKIQEKERDLL